MNLSFIKFPMLVLFFLVTIAITLKELGLLINISSSMPEGVYMKTESEIKRDMIVAACLDKAYKSVGLQNHYLMKGGQCHGSAPVIKKVIAVPGDDVVLSDNFMMVNHKKYLLKTLIKDSHGRNLMIYPRGKYVKTQGYWLVGTNSPKSWDSRYWGFVKRQQILYGLQKL